VQADEVVGVAFGLLAGGQLLSGVGDQAGLLLLFGGEGVGRLERDLLLGELVVYVGVGEAGVAGEDQSGDEEESGEQQPADTDHQVQGPTLHGITP
jgi:hypothetical protein